MNLPVAPFYVMPPDKAAAIKILLYQLTAGWCKVGHSTPMNVKLSKTPPFTNPPNVVGDFRRANSSLFNSRKRFETVIKTIIKQ
jgi:hypothetical protein